MESYKQTTYETCLAVSLMLLTGIEPDKNKEISVWKSGWKFNFLIGQVNYICQEYKKKLNVYIHNKAYYKTLLKQKSKGVTLVNKKIDSELINSLLNEKPIIIYIDNFVLQKLIHAPHFLLLTSSTTDHYYALDALDGEEKLISKHVIDQGIDSLRKHLKFSPVLICEDH